MVPVAGGRPVANRSFPTIPHFSFASEERELPCDTLVSPRGLVKGRDLVPVAGGRPVANRSFSAFPHFSSFVSEEKELKSGAMAKLSL